MKALASHRTLLELPNDTDTATNTAGFMHGNDGGRSRQVPGVTGV